MEGQVLQRHTEYSTSGPVLLFSWLIRSPFLPILLKPSLTQGISVQAKYANTNLLLPSEQLLGNSAEASQAQGPIVEQFVSSPLPRDENLALVDDWDCLRVSSPTHLACFCCAAML